MQRLPLQSHALRSAGYDPKAGTLELEFRSGGVYQYSRVPPGVYDWLLRCENKGVYVSRHLLGRFGERRVGPPPVAPAEPLSDALERSLSALRESRAHGSSAHAPDIESEGEERPPT